MSEIGFSTSLTTAFDTAVERVTHGLKQEGFGVLTEIDVQATMKKKLDVEMPAYRILGACNPKMAHQAIGCRGVRRSDFRFDDSKDPEGEVIWLEVNTQPGMTPTSLVPELAQLAGYDFGALVSWIVEDASCSR